MATRTNLDMDVLRTFVTGFELGSFARAAERLGRSQSAVSTQLRKLEEQVGQPLVQKAGRGLALTAAGESMLGYAKRLLELNDEAVDRLRGTELEGWARLGLAQDFAESWLPAVLKRFSRAYPRVRIEVQVGLGAQLIEKTLKDELDVALVWATAAAPLTRSGLRTCRSAGSARRTGRVSQVSGGNPFPSRPSPRRARSGPRPCLPWTLAACPGGWSSRAPASRASGPQPRVASASPRAPRSACRRR